MNHAGEVAGWVAEFAYDVVGLESQQMLVSVRDFDLHCPIRRKPRDQHIELQPTN